jgi:hypothetical protein
MCVLCHSLFVWHCVLCFLSVVCYFVRCVYFCVLCLIAVSLPLGKNPFAVQSVQLNNNKIGARGSVVVKALCYKPEGRGFETR